MKPGEEKAIEAIEAALEKLKENGWEVKQFEVAEENYWSGGARSRLDLMARKWSPAAGGSQT
jgi:hypothetical protein